MSRAREFKLVDVAARRACWETVRTLPADWTVTVHPPGRTLKQNRFLWRLLGKLEKSKIEWAGQTWDRYGWHDIVLSGHAVATRGERLDNQPSLIEGFEGEPLQVRESVASMSKERLSSLIAYVDAWMAGKPEFQEEVPPEWEGR